MTTLKVTWHVASDIGYLSWPGLLPPWWMRLRDKLLEACADELVVVWSLATQNKIESLLSTIEMEKGEIVT